MTSEQEQTAAKNGDAGVASVSTPEKNIASKSASQQSKTAANPSAEVLIEHGEAPFDFDKNNRLSYFVRTITETGQERLYWGKDLPRALGHALMLLRWIQSGNIRHYVLYIFAALIVYLIIAFVW
jgi:hypothetical protein